MAEERVVLTAELRDQMSAPLQNAQRRVEGFSDAVESGSRRQATAVSRSTAQIDGSLTRQNRLYSGMGGVIGRATDGAARMFSGMRSAITRSLDGIPEHATRAGERAGSGFADGLKKLIGPALALLGAQQIFSFANGAVESFSMLEDSSAAAGVVFGDSMQKILDQAATADKTLGLSQQAVITGGNTFGTYGKAAGLAGDDLATFATGLTGLAGDMASFKGTSTEQALEAIAAGLRGEAEPLRAFGVMLDDVQMRDEAMRMGLIKTTKDALTPQQKVLAAQSLIFAQTTDAQGDFARTSQSTANIAKTLAAASENLSAKIGKVLAPTFTAVRVLALGAVSGLSKFFDGVLKAQEILAAGGTNADIATALGLTGPAKAIFEEGLGSIRAFFAAFKAGDGEVTSSGVAGFFERLGGVLRETWDAGVKVVQWLWDMRTPIGIIAGLIITALIPHWIDLGVKALASAAQQKIAWGIARAEAMKAAFVHSWAVVTMVGGWLLMGAQATIQAVKIAAAWVIALGPVAWIIAGIAALVAGVIWAYNNIGWFKDGVDAAFKFIGDIVKIAIDWIVGAFNNLVSFWQTNVAPGLAMLGQWFSDVFTNIGNWARDFIGFFVDGWGMLVDFWNGVLMPIIQAVGDVFAAVFDWIGRLVHNAITIIVFIFLKLVDLWNGVLMPALQNLGNFIGTIMTWIYDVLIKPYIDLIVGGFNMLVDFWNGILMPGLQALGDFIGSIFNWIYNVLIKPVIDFIVAGFQGLVDFWNLTVIPGLQALGDFIGSIMTWIYDTLIKPYIDLLVGAFGMLVDFWNGVLSPAIDSVGKWFSDVIGGAISGAQGFIGDLVKGFESFVKFVGDKLQPVIDGIKGGFETLGTIIDGVLGKIGEFMNNPLGGIQDMLGIAKDENGQGIMPSNSGGGVYAGNGVRFAGGGVLGGYAPGRDSILARLSPGESVLVPELTRAIGPANIMAANAEASGGRPAGSGPSLTSGYSSGRSGGATTMVAEGAVQINIQAGPNGVSGADIDQIRDAVNAIFEEQRRRGY